MCGDGREGEQGTSRNLVMTRGWRGQPQRGQRAGERDIEGMMSSLTCRSACTRAAERQHKVLRAPACPLEAI